MRASQRGQPVTVPMGKREHTAFELRRLSALVTGEGLAPAPVTRGVEIADRRDVHIELGRRIANKYGMALRACIIKRQRNTGVYYSTECVKGHKNITTLKGKIGSCEI